VEEATESPILAIRVRDPIRPTRRKEKSRKEKSRLKANRSLERDTITKSRESMSERNQIKTHTTTSTTMTTDQSKRK
jgi:hypothetical protein